MDTQSVAKEKYAAHRSKRSSQLPLSSAMNYALNTLHPVEILTFHLSIRHCNISWGFDDGVRITDTISFSGLCPSSIFLTLRLLMSYIYGAPSKARNANVVYIWTYVWQR